MSSSVNEYSNFLTILSEDLYLLKDSFVAKDINETEYNIDMSNIDNRVEIIRGRIVKDNDRLNDLFATILNEDFTEIYKTKYLRNWGYVFSLFVALCIIRRI